MSLNLNKVILTGNATKDAELVKNDKITVVKFSVAVNRSYKDKGGKWVNDVDYFPVRAYNELAEYLAEEIKKGSSLEVIGSLRQNSFTVNDQNRSEIYIELNNKSDIVVNTKQPKEEV